MLHSATFWLFVSMAIFLAIAGKPAGRAITSLLDKRRDSVQTALSEAERLRSEAQELLIASQRQHREAVQEAMRIVAEAREDAARLQAEAAAGLEQSLAAREAAALAKIAEAEATATREARELATQLALAASRDLLRQKMTGNAADALIDKAIADLPHKLAG